MLLKRAQRGQLALVEAVKKLRAEVLAGPSTGDPDMVANAKKIGLFLLGAAYERFLEKIEEQQEVVAGITDVLMYAYAMESAILRAKKSGRANSRDMAQVFAQEAMGWIEARAKEVLAACSEGDALRMNLAVLRRFTKLEVEDTIALRRVIAGRLMMAGRYTV
jgi:butyryl-CoA dehydrogenase